MALKVSRILHAGYLFDCDGVRVVFDPIFENPFSVNCHAFPDVRFDLEQIKTLDLSAVFISHYHDDHCSLESLALLDRATPIYVFCIFEELISLIKALGFENVTALSLGTPVTIGPFSLTPLRALDADVDSLFHVNVDGLNVLNVVDSWIDPEMMNELEKLAPWDLVLWPFQTMRELEVLSPSRAAPASRELPPEWMAQLIRLKPKFLVPSSCQFQMEPWSWYNRFFFPITYEQFNREVSLALPHTQITRLNPGVSVFLEKDSLTRTAPISWIEPLGEQDADYEFDESAKAPSTAEIAQRFRPLEPDEAKRAFDFCCRGLLKRLRELEPLDESYFSKRQHWRLTVYDHNGAPTSFDYVIEGRSIELSAGDDSLLSWTTEVPLTKLFAALEEGESLTSMYVRINDTAFTKDVEASLKKSDLMEDPLVRCLFEGKFGEYQRAQLMRIKARNS